MRNALWKFLQATERSPEEEISEINSVLTLLRIFDAAGLEIDACIGLACLVSLCGDGSGWSQYNQTQSADDTLLNLAGVTSPRSAGLCLLCLMN